MYLLNGRKFGELRNYGEEALAYAVHGVKIRNGDSDNLVRIYERRTYFGAAVNRHRIDMHMREKVRNGGNKHENTLPYI